MVIENHFYAASQTPLGDLSKIQASLYGCLWEGWFLYLKWAAWVPRRRRKERRPRYLYWPAFFISRFQCVWRGPYFSRISESAWKDRKFLKARPIQTRSACRSWAPILEICSTVAITELNTRCYTSTWAPLLMRPWIVNVYQSKVIFSIRIRTTLKPSGQLSWIFCIAGLGIGSARV